MPHDRYKNVISDALKQRDMSQAQLHQVTGLGTGTISRWLKVLVAEGHVHVWCHRVPDGGGPLYAVYRFGPKPKWHRPHRPKAMSDLDRYRAYRKRLRESGEWEHRKALDRARHRADRPVRDPLTSALFGPVTSSGAPAS